MNGQVLPGEYTFGEARMVLGEMVEASVLELVEQGLVCERISLSVGYAKGAVAEGGSAGGPAGGAGVGDPDSLRVAAPGGEAPGKAAFDEVFEFGPGHTGGTRKLERRTSSLRYLRGRFEELFDETTRRGARIKRLSVGFGDLLPEEYATVTLLDDVQADAKEHRLQEAMVAVRGKFGKNALLKAASLQDKATARERNCQVGGHHE